MDCSIHAVSSDGKCWIESDWCKMLDWDSFPHRQETANSTIPLHCILPLGKSGWGWGEQSAPRAGAFAPSLSTVGSDSSFFELDDDSIILPQVQVVKLSFGSLKSLFWTSSEVQMSHSFCDLVSSFRRKICEGSVCESSVYPVSMKK